MKGIRGAIDDVDRFHKAIPEDIVQDIGDRAPALTRGVMRRRLLLEELRELDEAMIENDMEEVADAYADIIYIVLGSAIMHVGKERFARVWDEVQRSNMAKLTDGKMVMREDGKILKPEGWTPPDIKKAFMQPDDVIGRRMLMLRGSCCGGREMLAGSKPTVYEFRLSLADMAVPGYCVRDANDDVWWLPVDQEGIAWKWLDEETP